MQDVREMKIMMHSIMSATKNQMQPETSAAAEKVEPEVGQYSRNAVNQNQPNEQLNSVPAAEFAAADQKLVDLDEAPLNSTVEIKS
jgi:hypothetical protein